MEDKKTLMILAKTHKKLRIEAAKRGITMLELSEKAFELVLKGSK